MNILEMFVDEFEAAPVEMGIDGALDYANLCVENAFKHVLSKRAARRKATEHKANRRAARAKAMFMLEARGCNAFRNRSEAYGMGNNGYSSKRWYSSRQSELADIKAKEELADYYAEERIPIKERFHQLVDAYNSLVGGAI